MNADKPISDERGRFCSYNTLCGRNCTPKERDHCRWWAHAKEEPKQMPIEFSSPLSHAKDKDGR